MELSTKKLFYSKINKSKKKLLSLKKNAKTPLNSKSKLKKTIKKLNRYTAKEKDKNKLSNNDIPLCKVKNPFSCNQIKFEKNIKRNNLSTKIAFIKLNTIEKIHGLNNKKEEISDFTNIVSTTGSETYRKQDNFDLDRLCNEFKNSDLKSNFIIDKNGNNILNLEQKNYSCNKKENLQKNINKCKINQIEEKRSNILRNKALCSKIYQYKYSVDIRRKVLSSKEHNKFLNLFGDNIIKKNYHEETKDNNSLFESLSDKSMDSSFIDSDDDEKLILAIQNSCDKN